MNIRNSALIAALLLVGCAGPTTPFGAKPVSQFFNNVKRALSRGPANENAPSIQFSPHRQVLHGRSRFTITIEDLAGIQKDFRLQVNYNGVDMTNTFLAQAHLNRENEKKLRVTFPNLRLPATKDHDIEVVYWHSLDESETPLSRHYGKPECFAFKPEPVKNTGEFKNVDRIVRLLNQVARDEKVNPSFIAGLIAQESGFDSRAVSSAKAIGLTQVTSLGEAEFIDDYKHWPRFPELSDMSAPIVKLNILTGTINSENEWRLDPKLSISGGVAYIEYLDNYWRRPEAMSMVSSHYTNPEDVLTSLILASYNSGAARVSNALRKYGKNWLSVESELSEARKYVNRVTSFCDYFSNGEDEDATPPENP